MLRAVCESDWEGVDKALEEGWDINAGVELHRGLNSIAIAAEINNLEMVHYLHLKGADINMQSGVFKTTPLMAATMMWNTKIVEYFLYKGVDLKVTNIHGFTALQLAEFK